MNFMPRADTVKGAPVIAPGRARGARSRVRSLLTKFFRLVRTLVLISPSILGVLYFGVFATDRYVSEAQFVVRTAAKPAGGAGLGALLQMTGLGRAQDDVFSVQSFMTSRDAVELLSKDLPLRDIYGRPEADVIARYPSVFYGSTAEELHKYLSWMVTTIYSSTTGITTLRVQAFRAEDAKAIASLLLDLGEQTVNRMNERIQNEGVRTSESEVARHQQRMIDAQLAITKFRNAELMIDPAGSSIVVAELIGRLASELAQNEAKVRELDSGSPNSPQLASLRRRSEALQEQIVRERRRISSRSDGLADKLAVYERLTLDREFAKLNLTAAVRGLETSQQEARRQQLYLERVVEPAKPDYPMAPERLRMIATVMGLNLIGLLVGWLVFAGVGEHAAQPEH
jgi:capsular polysaccharide transport system permease protein